MKVTFVRHGATEWAGSPRLLARTDVALSELGRQQAQAVGRHLAGRPFDALWSSPLGRCRTTAQAIGLYIGHVVVLDERLREVDVGELEGKAFTDLPDGPGSFRDRWQKRPGNTRFPGGETVAAAGRRVWRVLEDLYDRHPDGHVVVVSHMLAISAALTRVLQLKAGQFRTFAIDTASLTTVLMARGGFRLLQLNEVAHLDLLPAGPNRTPQALPARTKPG